MQPIPQSPNKTHDMQRQLLWVLRIYISNTFQPYTAYFEGIEGWLGQDPNAKLTASHFQAGTHIRLGSVTSFFYVLHGLFNNLIDHVWPDPTEQGKVC